MTVKLGDIKVDFPNVREREIRVNENDQTVSLAQNLAKVQFKSMSDLIMKLDFRKSAMSETCRK